MDHHQRQRYVPQIRLEQPLPPLPQLPSSTSPITPQIRIAIPDQAAYEPYHDATDSEDGLPEEEMVGLRDSRGRRTNIQRQTGHLSPLAPSRSPSPSPTISFRTTPTRTPAIEISPAAEITPMQETSPNRPPEYEPMYDYLRSRPPPAHPFTSPNSNTFLSPISAPQSPVDYMPYHDDVDHPFIITLSPLSPMSRPAPGEPAPPSYEELYLQHPCPRAQTELAQLVRDMDAEGGTAEEVCKFMVGMLMLAICVVGVGFSFNWGKGWGPDAYQGQTW